MGEPEPRQRPPRAGAGKLALLTLAGATAVAWLQNRKGEEVLRERTELRLRSFAERAAR